MKRKITAALKRFIVNAVVDDYVNNGRVRAIVAAQGQLKVPLFSPAPPPKSDRPNAAS